MSDSLITALASVFGTVLVAVIALVGQRAAARATSSAETQRLRLRIVGEEASRLREKRREQMVEAISEILAASDPQIFIKLDYGRVVTLIHRIQLLLDIREVHDARLNTALNGLGSALQEYAPAHHLPVDDKSPRMRAVFAAQSEVTESARAILHRTASLEAT